MTFARRVKENLILRRILGLGWHLVGIVACYIVAFYLKFDFVLSEKNLMILIDTLPYAVVVFASMIGIFGLYQGLWRFFTFRDCLITAVAFGIGTLLLSLVIYLFEGSEFGGYPRSVWAINYLLILGWEIGGRGIVRIMREWRIDRMRGRHGGKLRTILIGDFEECNALIRAVQQQRETLGKVIGILVDGKVNRGTRLQGVKVYSDVNKLAGLVAELQANNVVILPPFQQPGRLRKIVDSMSEHQISPTFRVMPSIDDLATGVISVSQIRKVEIEDLLEREPYEMDVERLREFVSGKRIMVTGAGGSIGSEICRQLISLNPGALILFESSEFHLFEIERELTEASNEHGVQLVACAGDVRNEDHLQRSIDKSNGVDIIYHAAAYKHVDLMERNPYACFQNNVIGTATVARIAEENGASDCVLVSTDKAVRPTSLMGASKRIAERIMMERPVNGTRFKAVRFGNVLGSSGSVVPIFRGQISEGGPVTVTSKDVTRFFMTIPEAVELVLAAGAVGEDRRICVLEMGRPVKIDSLARRMIELSGFVPDSDIPIVYTGLKPGEKEYEELLTDDENVERTDHDRIWVVTQGDQSRAEAVEIGRFLELLDEGDEVNLRGYVHSLIPGSRLLDSK